MCFHASSCVSDEKDFVLQDSSAESEFDFSFAKSLERARTKKMFEVRKWYNLVLL